MHKDRLEGTVVVSIKRMIKEAARSVFRKDVIAINRVISAEAELSGRTAFISGGSGGIGLAVARALLDAGANVVLGGTRQEKLDKSAAGLDAEGRVATVKMDLQDVEEIDAAVKKAASCFDGIDILVASSGVHTEQVDFWTMTPAEYDRVMSVNLRGAYFLGRAVAKDMIDREKKGHILFVNSSRGFEPAWSPYAVSKWGLRGLTQGLAQVLLPYGIAVNGIAPGSTATPLIGFKEGDSVASEENAVGRMIMPEEIASWVKMLVGPSGDMVLGETILVSGGRGGIDIR